jgi:hypothetical protein
VLTPAEDVLRFAGLALVGSIAVLALEDDPLSQVCLLTYLLTYLPSYLRPALTAIDLGCSARAHAALPTSRVRTSALTGARARIGRPWRGCDARVAWHAAATNALRRAAVCHRWHRRRGESRRERTTATAACRRSWTACAYVDLRQRRSVRHAVRGERISHPLYTPAYTTLVHAP